MGTATLDKDRRRAVTVVNDAAFGQGRATADTLKRLQDVLGLPMMRRYVPMCPFDVGKTQAQHGKGAGKPHMIIENRPFDQLQPGDTAELRRLVTGDDLLVFANASGNHNPMHNTSATRAVHASENATSLL